MKYWYRMSDADKWERACLDGREYKVPLYEETEEIRKDFANNELSDWWPLRRENSYAITDEDEKFDFKSEKDAQNDLMVVLNEGLYCKLHGC